MRQARIVASTAQTAKTDAATTAFESRHKKNAQHHKIAAKATDMARSHALAAARILAHMDRTIPPRRRVTDGLVGAVRRGTR